MNKLPQSESTPRRSSAIWPRLAALLVAVVFAIGVGAAGPTVGTSGAADTVRVVVQLDEPPLALYRDTLPGLDGVLDARTPDGHLNVQAAASRAYRSHLSARQAEFERRLEAASHRRRSTGVTASRSTASRCRCLAQRSTCSGACRTSSP